MIEQQQRVKKRTKQGFSLKTIVHSRGDPNNRAYKIWTRKRNWSERTEKEPKLISPHFRAIAMCIICTDKYAQAGFSLDFPWFSTSLTRGNDNSVWFGRTISFQEMSCPLVYSKRQKYKGWQCQYSKRKQQKNLFPLQFHKAFHVASLRSKGYIWLVHLNEIKTSEIDVVGPPHLTHPKTWSEYVSN